ncbi:hypothetical protein [Bradyrhizobium sp. ISRA463]|uniref:hypothetical protein n=1 Tax=Bradyrhizobium sp. ISRA463 TaxID=2866199 RepID=UPI00247ACFBD|nr:hypothetical protein [Bradyrhizobium sp. ISRA463]WGS22202.1 hypothetical protein MTX22_11275 [Bradyrhizobium sp. ISRA463]
MPKHKVDKLARAKARPNPAQWDEDEVMTLVEAVAVFFPDGPLTLSSLRKATAVGTLEIAKVAGKDLTTPRAIRKMVKPSCRAAKPNRRDSGCEKTKDAGSSSINRAESDGRSAQAAAAMTPMEQRALENTSSLPSFRAASGTSIPVSSSTEPRPNLWKDYRHHLLLPGISSLSIMERCSLPKLCLI